MSIQNINRGTTANDGNGDTARAAALKINENFAYLLNAEATFKLIEGTAVNRESLETDVAAVINAGSPFTLAFANFAFIKYFEIVDGDIVNIYFFKIMKIGGGDKTFGNSGAITLASENLFLTGEKLKSVQDFEELNTTVTEDFGDIGSTSLIDYVNGLSPKLYIQATSVGATIIRAVVDDVQESYLFKGDAGDYGDGELQLVDADLEALAQSTQVSVIIDTELNQASFNPVANQTLSKEFDQIAIDIQQAKALIPTNNNELTNGAGYITSADGGNAATLGGLVKSDFVRKTGDIDETITGIKNFKNRATFNDNTWIEDTGAGITIISQNDDVPVNMIFRPNGRASAVGQMVIFGSNVLEFDGEIRATTFNGDGSKLDNVDALTLNGLSAADFQLKNEKGSANGYASLVGGKVPVNQLPSYVDDVLEFASLLGFPNAGETGKIYIALDTNKQYRWTGSNYLQITNGLIASTNDLPEGSNNLYFTVARVLATLLTGFTPFGLSANLVATDSIFTALRKLQFRVALNDAKVVITNFISRTGNVDESINGEKTFSNKTLVPSNSGVKGSGFGSSNFSIFSFYGSDGTTRQGYIGFGSTNDSDYFLVNDVSGKRLVLKENGDFDYNGDVIATKFIGSGSDLTDVDAETLGGLDKDDFAKSNVKTKTSATSYLFQDSNKTVAPLFTSGSSVSAVVKLGTPIGTKFVLSQFGTGTVTITGQSGVTLRFPSGELAVPASRYSFVQLEVVDTNEVAVIGRLKQA
jgi:hypothetical protein